MSKNSIYKNFMWKFAERMAAQIVTTVVSIVLARILDPADYGTISLITVFIALCNVVMVSGFGNALIQKKNTDTVDFSTVFYFNLLFSLVMYVIIFMTASPISRFYGIEILKPIIRVMGLSVIIASINSVQHAYVSKKMIFRKFFFSTLFGTILSGIIGVALALYGAGVWSLVAQYMINLTVDTVVLWITVKWYPTKEFSLERLKELFGYGWKLFISGFLDTGYSQLRTIIIGKIYTAKDLAYYDQGQKYPQLLIANINSSISSVLLPSMAKEQDNIDNVKKMTRIAVSVSSYILWPMMVGLAVVAEPFIRILLTEKWLFCVPYLKIACFTFVFWPIHTANLEAIKAIGRSDIFLKMEIIKKGIGIALILISVKFGVIGIALSGVINSLIGCIINSIPNKKILNYGLKEQFVDILPEILLSLGMGLVIFPFKYMIEGDWALIIIQILVGASFYIIMSILLKIKAFEYIIEKISKR